MRRWLVVLALAAGCSHHAASGEPAWPKLHESETDGGESLEPRVARPVEVAAHKSADDPKPEPTLTIAPAAAPTPAAKEPSAATPTAPLVPPGEEPITVEDLVIEIDD